MASASNITKKALNPAKFGFNTMRELTAKRIATVTIEKLNTMNEVLSPGVINACTSMVEAALKGKNNHTAEFGGLNGNDIGIINSDFGEITGAIYMLSRNKDFQFAKFPIDEAQKILDYYLVKNGVAYPVSAKAGAGGAPSITSVKGALSDLKKNNSLPAKYNKAVEVISLLSVEKDDTSPRGFSGLYSGPLLAAQYLNTDGWKALVKLLKRPHLNTGYKQGIPTQEHLLAAVNSCGKDFETCLKEFKLFLAAAGVDVNSLATKRAIENPKSSKDKAWGILHYPITGEIKNWLNKDINLAKDILTKAANTLNVTQVYLDCVPEIKGATEFKSGVLTYTIAQFSDSKFEYFSPSSTPNPVGNRIGLKMIKKGHK